MISLFLPTSFYICLIVLSHTNIEARRSRRYLVYPDGGPARTQFIIGLGVPVDLKEQSVTVGTVIKFQYDLPTNSTEYTSRIYGFANTVSRDMDGDEPDTKTDINTDTDIESERSSDKSSEEEEDDDNALVDITFNDRRKRSLAYTEAGVIKNNDLVANSEIPLEEAIRIQEEKDKAYLQENERKKANRWDYYKVLEQMIGRYGFLGRPCLLRTICEAAEVPFTHENGLLAEIGHILFTPSTTKDALSHHTDNEYHAAERLGRELGVDCETLFPECESSILETFTQIGMDTMHKFGL